MPETWLEEINRGSQAEPGASIKEYVQWQRGLLTRHLFEDMKAWIDTTMNHDNIWLVLVIHRVENLGWEAKTRAELKDYFSFMKTTENALWIETFRDVTKYVQARQNTTVESKLDIGKITISLASELDPNIYTVPLTIKTYIPDDWKQAKSSDQKTLAIRKDAKGKYVLIPLSLTESQTYITN